MNQPSTDSYFAEIQASAARLAEIVSTHDPDLRVPTCPDWTLRQLGTHVGRVHRWAAAIVASRATERIPFDSVPDGKYPAAAEDRAAWLNAGADRVIAAIKAAGDQPVWAFGRLAPATFWARRQAHETAVHRIDAELAVGQAVVLDAGLAADGIDEWLGMLAGRGYRGADATKALPAGARLQLRATAPGAPDADAAAEWMVGNTGAGLSLQRGSGPADVSVSGPADRLLLALVRRAPADDPALAVTGAATLFSGWLAATPF
ncbi:MAG TPA: maleylpyruvate isomerase family mycothiol-dependent enzyme [Streptosporangiaceae bacterium]|nr:maleylpyruvate isomerase family mycothiol-dependent enzyme [Streptosporangiaceae bacterium]